MYALKYLNTLASDKNVEAACHAACRVCWLALRDVQTQANLLDAVVEMNTRQTSVEQRADNIEDSLRCLQVRSRPVL